MVGGCGREDMYENVQKQKEREKPQEQLSHDIRPNFVRIRGEARPKFVGILLLHIIRPNLAQMTSEPRGIAAQIPYK